MIELVVLYIGMCVHVREIDPYFAPLALDINFQLVIVTDHLYRIWGPSLVSHTLQLVTEYEYVCALLVKRYYAISLKSWIWLDVTKSCSQNNSYTRLPDPLSPRIEGCGCEWFLMICKYTFCASSCHPIGGNEMYYCLWEYCTLTCGYIPTGRKHALNNVISQCVLIGI